MKRPLLIGLLVFFLLVILAGSTWWYARNLQTPSSMPAEPPTDTSQTPSVSGYAAISPTLTKKGNGVYALALALDPETSVGLSTLTLQITLSPDQGKIVNLSSNPEVNPELKGNGWTFPFNTLTTTPEGAVVLKTSLVYASPETYNVSEPLNLVTIPLNIKSDTQALNLTIDPEVSKIYTKQNELINFTAAGTPAPIPVPYE